MTRPRPSENGRDRAFVPMFVGWTFVVEGRSRAKGDQLLALQESNKANRRGNSMKQQCICVVFVDFDGVV